jgi:HSP20 family protein
MQNMQKTTNREDGDRSPEFAPAVDIYDREDEIVLVADMPGVPADAVDINLDRGELTIRGRVNAPPVTGPMVFQEYQVGDFVRTFTLTDDIDPNGIAAEMSNGVLKLHLKKPAERKPRKIPVKVG